MTHKMGRFADSEGQSSPNVHSAQIYPVPGRIMAEKCIYRSTNKAADISVLSSPPHN